MKTMSLVSFMLFFFIGISISMLIFQANYHQQTFAQSSMINIEEKTIGEKYNNNNNFIIKISTEEGTDAGDGLGNQEVCNRYLEAEGCEIGGSTTTTTTTEQNVTQRLEEKLLEGKQESIPSPPTSPQSPPTIPFASFSNDSSSISDTQLASNSTGQFSNSSMGNISGWDLG
jgi:hypothetical protein